MSQPFYIILWYKNSMDISKVVGNNLQLARKDKKYTQAQVAEILHMTQQQYSRFENGVFELNYSLIVTLCNLYEITPNELFSFE